MTDLRRAEEAVIEAAIVAEAKLGDDHYGSEPDHSDCATCVLRKAITTLTTLRASQAGEPCRPGKLCGAPDCDAPTPAAEEADGICDSFGHRQSCRVYRGGTCDAPPAEEAKEICYCDPGQHPEMQREEAGPCPNKCVDGFVWVDKYVGSPCPSCAPSPEKGRLRVNITKAIPPLSSLPSPSAFK